MYKVIMNRTVQCISTGWVFYKGHIYHAVDAVNQPNCWKMKKVFVEKKNGESMMLVAGDYFIKAAD